MYKLKQSLDKLLLKIRQQNPDATWGNLITGVMILVLLAVSSIWYLGKTIIEPTQEQLLNEILETGTATEVVEDTVDVETTLVEAGESLWKVAERVCGNGEAYNILAEANGLTIYSPTYVGQELVVVCE